MNIFGSFQTLQISVYYNPTTCLHILCHKRYIYHIMEQDFLFFLIAVCPVLPVTVSQLFAALQSF